jgi:hypothetical protein
MRDDAGGAVLFSCIFRSARKLSIKSALIEELHNQGGAIKQWQLNPVSGRSSCLPLMMRATAPRKGRDVAACEV